MGATYTVREVLDEDSYSFPDKDNPQQMVHLASYELKVDGPATADFDPVTMTAWQDKPIDADKPKPGDELFVDPEKGGRGKIKLKRAAKRDRDRTPADTPGSKAGYRQQDPPESVARIGRAHAQEMALRFLAATGGEPDLDLTNEKDVGQYLNGPLARLTKWFAQDVDRAGKAVEDGD